MSVFIRFATCGMNFIDRDIIKIDDQLQIILHSCRLQTSNMCKKVNM